MKTLLDRAKGKISKQKKVLKKDELDLALAWVNDVVSIGQVSAAYKCSTGTAYIKLATTLKAYFQGTL